MNHHIKGVQSVRLVDEKGEQLGIVRLPDAMKMAQERGFDLVEVSQESDPPVARFMDYGKYKYKQKKKFTKSKKKQHAVHIKEIRLRPATDQHDLDTKFKHAREFLVKGDKVIVTMMFRDRERKHIDIGRARLEQAVKDLADLATPDSNITMEGYRLSVTLTPKAVVVAAAPPTQTPTQTQSQEKE